MSALPSRRGSGSRGFARRGFALMEAVLGGLLLAVSLTAILSLAMRSMQMTRDGEEEVVAAALLDELLSMVLVEGPVDFPKLHDTAGRFEAPFAEWQFDVLIEPQELGDPWRVLAQVRSPRGETYRCGTFMAPRPENAPPVMRRPPQRIEREDRYEAQRQINR